MTEQNKSPEAIQDVRLLSLPENLKEIVYTACRTCYSDENPGNIFKEASLGEYAFNNGCPHLDFCDYGSTICELQEAACDFDLEKNENYLDRLGSSYELSVCREWKEKKEKDDLENKTADDKILKLINKVLSSNHYSTVEHCYFVFSLSGLSRACTHQIVRHRHMSFSQKSQRYVEEKGQFEYIVPDSIKNLKPAYDKVQINFRGFFNFTDQKQQVETMSYDQIMQLLQTLYSDMIRQGIPAEDARYILPNAAASSMVASLNLRELIHLANLRTCMKAQKEIRDVVKKMCDLVIEKEPWLKDYLVPQCAKNKKCTEHNGCGRFKNEN